MLQVKGVSTKIYSSIIPLKAAPTGGHSFSKAGAPRVLPCSSQYQHPVAAEYVIANLLAPGDLKPSLTLLRLSNTNSSASCKSWITT